LVGDAKVLAVDVPTGLDADTGIASGAVLAAERTVTFAAAKPGHVLGDGPDLVGELVVADIGLPVDSATMGIVESADVDDWMPRRGRRDHKWRHAVRIVAGSSGMTGAASLVAEAAQRTGSGMVVTSSPGVDESALVALFPREVVTCRLSHVDWSGDVLADLGRFHALVVGPGLGRHEATIDAALRTIADAGVPVVVDGDGLYALASDQSDGAAVLRDRTQATVLTPHDAEFERLSGAVPGDDRVEAVRRLAARTDAIVLLKGPTTIVADPSGRTYLVVAGDQRLATAGTGDVLAGVIGALLAMGTSPTEAAAGGAWIHASAGALLPPLGLVAGDLIAAIPHVLRSCAP
jgi:NAD(P)H-hydrate epimerase